MTATTTRHERGRTGGTVALRAAVAAEFVRTKGSGATWFVPLAIVVAALQALGWIFVATGPARDWFGLLGWQTLYATGLLAPLTVLLAAVTVGRERTAREGGTWARPLAPGTAALARFLVCGLQLGAIHLILTAPLLGLGLALGLSDPPVGRLVTLWIVLWAAALLPAAVAFLLARRLGLLATVGVGLAWQVAGTLQAESPLWWAQPWTWGVRAAIRVLGIHANGVRLAPDAPAWAWSPWPPTLAALATTALIVGMLAATARPLATPAHSRRRVAVRVRRGGDAESRADEPRPTAGARRGLPQGAPAGPRSLAAALWLVLRGTAVPALLAASVLGLALVAVVWDHRYVTGVTTWLLLPMGCSALAVLAWSAHEPGWRAVALRVPPRRAALTLGGLCAAILALVVLIAALAAAATGGADLARTTWLWWCLGTTTLAVSLWLATRFGAGAALSATLVTLVVSLVFSGSGFAATGLWLAGPLGWPSSADTPQRGAIATAACLIATTAATLAWLRATRRVVAR